MNMDPFEFGEDLNNFLLFKKLREKLGTDCILPASRAKATESHANLNEAIEKYFRNFITMDIVSSRRSTLLEENSSQSSDKTLEEEMVFQSHPLHLNTFKVHLQQSGISEELKCQGIDEEFVSDLLNKKKEKSLQLTKELEAGIKEFCNILPKYSNHWYKRDGSWLQSFKGFVKAQESQMLSLEAERAMIESNKKSLNDMILTYYKELIESISILYELISLHEKKLQMELNFTNFFSLKFVALYSKAKIIQLDVLEKTYTKETIPALRVIKAKANEKWEHTSKEIEDKRVKLQAYKILGPNYENLVAEYSQLMTKITRLKWTMETLKERIKDCFDE